MGSALVPFFQPHPIQKYNMPSVANKGWENSVTGVRAEIVDMYIIDTTSRSVIKNLKVVGSLIDHIDCDWLGWHTPTGSLNSQHRLKLVLSTGLLVYQIYINC